jgi:hypothetical protein
MGIYPYEQPHFGASSPDIEKKQFKNSLKTVSTLHGEVHVH